MKKAGMFVVCLFVLPLIAGCNKGGTEESTFAITFDANGGYFDNDPTITQKVITVKENELPKCIAPEINDGHQTFYNWDHEIVAATSDATYKAVWGSAFQITFNGNGGYFDNDPAVTQKTIKTKENELPTCNEPTKSVEYLKHCFFDKWDQPIVEATADVTYMAVWGDAYQITFDGNGGYFDNDPAVTQKTIKVKKGEFPECPTPKKDRVEDVDYTFNGWSPVVSEATVDITYTATYTKSAYTVTWKNWDGEVLELDKGLHNGEMPEYNGPTPTKVVEPYGTYGFTGWAPEISAIDNADQVYIAQFAGEYNCDAYLQIVIDEANLNITLTCEGTITSIDWGDNESNAELSHNYLSPGTYNIKIIGDITSVQINNKACVNDLFFGSKITQIKENSFSSSTRLKSVVFSEDSSLETIGSGAFSGCASLTSIDIPNTVSTIGQSAFSGCTELISVNFPDDSILTSFSNWLFDGCKKLSSINIPDSVVSLGTRVFHNCESLTSIDISSNLKNMLNEIFMDCINLVSINFAKDSKIEYIGYEEFRGCAKLVSINIPSAVKIVYDGAFKNCISLTSVNLPSDSCLTEIGGATFAGCTSLATINIPSSVTKIGKGAFSGCNLLQYTKIEDAVCYLGNNENPYVAAVDIFDKTKTTYTISNRCKILSSGLFKSHEYLTSINIPDSVISIGEETFESCTFLTQVAISSNSNLVELGFRAFMGCSSLEYIYIPSGITFINNETFKDCSGMTSIDFSEGIEEIGSWVFEGTNLNYVIIPSSVTGIGLGCFNIPNISADLSAVSPASFMYDDSFGDNPSTLYVSEATIETWKLYYPEYKECFVVKPSI